MYARFYGLESNPMEIRVIVGVAALVGVPISGFISTITSYEMMDEVNAKLPKEAQFERIGWYASKTLRLHREYRRFYPDGRLLFKVRALFAVMAVCLLIGFLCLRPFIK